jgi:hypothetical protein
MRKKIWIRCLLAFAVVAIAGSAGLTRFLQTNSARRYLIAHLESSFGRPVEVRRFGFSLLDGARLEAFSLTVSEDPRFGNEYFLRADTLTAGLRWLALLSGRFEFGTLSLSQPSLNLVRDRQGRWNIEDWLPPAPLALSRAGFVGPRAAQTEPALERLSSIEVDDGRINFKQGDEKTPFALINVSGHVDQNGPGRWQLDLEAVPMRAGVTLQDSGTLRLRGTIAGTSARLQPADLNFTLRDVSLADAMRFARQSDSGVRGELDVDLNARVDPVSTASNGAEKTGGGRWAISGVARLRGAHRWDLPERATDPSLNLSVDASWRLGDRHAQIDKILIEMPRSHLQGAGELDWARGFRPEFRIESSSLGLGDVLDAYRAFRPGVPENLTLNGVIGLDATLAGWPLQLQQGAIASTGAKLAGPSLPAALKIGEINASVARGGLDFASTEISFLNPPARQAPDSGTQDQGTASSFLVHGAIVLGASGINPWPPNWSFSVEGETDRFQDWQAVAQILALPSGDGWPAAGGVAVKLSAVHRNDAPSTVWVGTLDTRGLTVSPVFLNQPLRLPRAHIEFTPTARTITLTAVEAFGAAWRGTLTRKLPDGQWTFDLSADRLDAADMDRWLGPRARPGLFARITNLGGLGANPANSAEIESAAGRLSARGRLRVAEFHIAPLELEQVDAAIALAGRKLSVEKATAQFFGGTVAASFSADLDSDPVYRFDGMFGRVNLGLLGSAMPSLQDRFSGIASGTVNLTAHGIGHDALVHSIQGSGTLDAKNAELRGLNLAPIVTASGADPIPARFTSAKGKFRFSSEGIEISEFELEHPPTHFQAEGHIDFSRALDIRINPTTDSTKSSPEKKAPAVFSLGGILEAPRWISDASAPSLPSKSTVFGK